MDLVCYDSFIQFWNHLYYNLLMEHPSIPREKQKKSKSFSVMQYKPKSDEQEFGLAENEYIMCGDCGAVYFDKSWHHSISEDSAHLKEKNLYKKDLGFKICPPCRMKKDKIYEGELILINIPEEKSRYLMNLIGNLNEEAQKRDFMDRILWREENGNEARLYLSENQLTVFMGRKVEEAFKNAGKLSISHNPEGPVRVKWEFHESR